MLSVLLYGIYFLGFYIGLKLGIYNGIVYGLIAKKIWRGTNNGLQIPYLFAGQAKCRGWGLIFTPGFAFIFIIIISYTTPFLEMLKKEAGEYITLVYIESYLALIGYLIFGIWFIYSGYKYGIKEKKIKTHYHLTDGQKYYIDNKQEKQRVASPHKYFRGTKAYKIGIVRIVTGFIAILFAFLLFLDRDYYAGSSSGSIYPNLPKILKPYIDKWKKEETEKEKQEELKKIDPIKEEKRLKEFEEFKSKYIDTKKLEEEFKLK